MNNYILSLLVIISTIMFFLSGIEKFGKIEEKTKGLADKLNTTSSTFLKILIVCAAILEIVAPLIILYCAFTGEHLYLGIIAAISLFIFTITVTIIYKYPPVGSRYYPFISNITTAGCMLLIAYIFNKKCN